MGFEPTFSTNYLTPVYQTGWIPTNLVDAVGIEPKHSDCKSGGLPLTSGP